MEETKKGSLIRVTYSIPELSVKSWVFNDYSHSGAPLGLQVAYQYLSLHNQQFEDYTFADLVELSLKVKIEKVEFV